MLKPPSINFRSRKWPLVLCALCAALMILPFLSGAEERLFQTKGPIVITAALLTADNKARTALFEGNVIAKTDTATLSSDRMLVFYTQDGKVDKIEASGKVKLMREDRVISADAATFFAPDEKVILTGQPKAVEGNNMMTGTRIIYLMKENRTIVENSKVFIEPGKGK